MSVCSIEQLRSCTHFVSIRWIRMAGWRQKKTHSRRTRESYSYNGLDVESGLRFKCDFWVIYQIAAWHPAMRIKTDNQMVSMISVQVHHIYDLSDILYMNIPWIARIQIASVWFVFFCSYSNRWIIDDPNPWNNINNYWNKKAQQSARRYNW